MPITCGFHPDAALEYTDAASYYLQEASPRLAEEFVASVERAITLLVSSPSRWRIVEEPAIRRYVLDRFPFVIYYRWESEKQRATVYAVMHCSREPGYWRHRLHPTN